MAPTDPTSPRTNRSHSISSDRPSMTGYGNLQSPPISTSPEPAFIAASAASQIVTNDHDSQADAWFDQHGIEPSGETAMVAPPSLKLVNQFLDQLLFNFLSVSRSTSLASLRPAVAEVLKPKLAKEAVSGADQELHEYLGGGEDEELMAFHNGLEPTGDWDLELVWKRTRLRCMVYSSLGDMEEEDEDLYTEQEQLDGPPGSNNRFSNNPGVVSPAVAIFLTSILEFMGEQVLVVAGQAAYHRLRAKHEREDKDGTSTHSEIAERVVVEESDMERVALDRTLGRLWRGWKKRIRSPNTSMSMSRSFSRESMRSPIQTSRAASIAPEENIKEDLQETSIDAALAPHEHAATIPLPLSDDDVREIEIPGLAKVIDDEAIEEEEEKEASPQTQRPKSLMIFTSHTGDYLLTPPSSPQQTSIFSSPTGRKRSHSQPSPAYSKFVSPSAKRAKSGIDEPSTEHVMEDQLTTNETSEPQLMAKSEEHQAEDAKTVEKLVTDETSEEQVMMKLEDRQIEDQDMADSSAIDEISEEHQVEDQVMVDKSVTDETSDDWAVTKAEYHVDDQDMAEKSVADETSDEGAAVATMTPEKHAANQGAATRLMNDNAADKQDTAKTEGHLTRDEEDKQPHEPRGLIAGVIAGAASIGATAVAGIAAVVNGQAPQTDVDPVDETDVDEEEPQILTSSRVSIGGRATPDETRAPSRQGSMRTNSVHSLRLIDVTSPKSPSRSRHGSVDATDYAGVGGRPLIGSRPNSMHSMLDGPTPRMASPVSRGPTSSPLVRAGSQLSQRRVSSRTEQPISEEREYADTDSESFTATPADIAAAMQGVDMSEFSSYQALPQSTAKDAAPEPTAFVLSAPPRSKARGNGFESLDEMQAPQSASNLGVSSKALGLEGGVPPLTPLREMMEGAPDTSDEASSIAPSQDGYSLSEHGPNGHSPTVSASSLANVQQNPPKSARPQTAGISRPRSSKEQAKRSNHTAGSASGSSSSSNKLKPVRTSEESNVHAAGDKSQSFEQLIHSDQTIQYTLTPQNMRNIEGLPESPRSPRFGVVAAPVVFAPQEAQRPPTSRSHSSSVNKYTGLYSNPPPEIPKLNNSPQLPRSTPVPVANTGARLRSNAPQPRDARVEKESMGDLAEFISSTAPSGSYEPFPQRTVSAASTQRGLDGITRNFSGSNTRAATANSLPRRAESSAGRSRLQARDAVVPRGDSISDLIDFVRSGPQIERASHRIPRTVAPFRTTMDSDQMAGAVGGKAVYASLPNPRYSQTTASMNSSINSQSALLSSSVKTNKLPPVQSLGKFEDEDLMPKRKQRKVRDMYQIDFSDEEDEYDSATDSISKPVREESLAEFLANVPPPLDSSPAPLYSVAAKTGKLKKKTSSPSLMSRFGRRDSGPQIPTKPKSSHGSGTRSSSRPPQLPSHTPIAVQFTTTKPAAYEPARGPTSDYVSQLDTARNKVSQKMYQPREAIYTSSRTSELAAFLKTEPPPSFSQPETFTPTLQRDEASAFQRMFSRKKVH